MVYLYNGQQILETNDGSGIMVPHVITRHTSNLPLTLHSKVRDQEATLNPNGRVPLVACPPVPEVINGDRDRDGDGDVDATDKGTPGTDCTGTVTGACRILDLDFDGDYDSTDAGLFDSLPQGVARHPGRFFTAVDQRFGHQGLLFEPEIGSYQNRARQYDPGKRRFVQRDPLAFRERAFNARRQYGDGLNVYAYERENSQSARDPFGLCTWKENYCLTPVNYQDLDKKRCLSNAEFFATPKDLVAICIGGTKACEGRCVWFGRQKGGNWTTTCNISNCQKRCFQINKVCCVYGCCDVKKKP